MVKLVGYVLAALCVAILPIRVSVGQSIEEKSVEQKKIEERILAAWKDRTQKLKSFQCTCALTRTDMISFEGAGDLFGEEAPGKKGPVELNSTFTLSMQGAKLAMHSKGEEWNHATLSRINQSYSRCFDGVSNKALIVGEVLSYPTAQRNNEQQAAAELTANTHYIPLWLSFSPADTLTRLKFDVSRMSVTDDRGFHQGRECIEVAIPRGTLTCHVYVDPSRGYLPVKYVEWRRFGKMRTDIDVEYEANEVLGWAVSSWVSSLYGGHEKVETSLSGKVESIAINRPISDNVFDIAFPVGTRIRETLDGTTKYFIQEADGARREIGHTRK